MDYSWELTDKEREALLTIRQLEKIEPGSVEDLVEYAKYLIDRHPEDPERKNAPAPKKAGSLTSGPEYQCT